MVVKDGGHPGKRVLLARFLGNLMQPHRTAHMHSDCTWEGIPVKPEIVIVELFDFIKGG